MFIRPCEVGSTEYLHVLLLAYTPFCAEQLDISIFVSLKLKAV